MYHSLGTPGLVVHLKRKALPHKALGGQEYFDGRHSQVGVHAEDLFYTAKSHGFSQTGTAVF